MRGWWSRQLLVAAFVCCLTYNACSPYESSVEQMSANSSELRETVSLNAFKTTLYPVLTTHCHQCHGNQQNPLFAQDDIKSAHDTILSFGLVDLQTPSNSYMMSKLIGGHQNFPQTVHSLVLVGISNWAQALADFDLGNTPSSSLSFAPSHFSSVLAKTKALAHGGAVTESEWQQMSGSSSNLNQLKQMINQWISTPEGEQKIFSFLMYALHQDVTLGIDGAELFNGATVGTAFNDSLRESFVRTALDIVKRNRPFTEVATTSRLAVNTALLSALAWVDNTRNPTNAFNIFVRSGVVLPSDYQDWRFVNLTAATAPVPVHTDLAHWRSIPDGSNVPMRIARVGYFSSMAFQSKYPTNSGNQFRVMANQTLIAGLGKTFSPGDTTIQPNEVGIDQSHSARNTQCFGCHRLMDPMKLTFEMGMDFNYRFRAPASPPQLASFAFYNYTTPLQNLVDLGRAVANHPDFALAWAQKLCVHFNTQKCVPSDPSLIAIANSFRSSNYNFKQLYVDMLVSDMVTGSVASVTSNQNSFIVSAQRQGMFCHSLNVKERQLQGILGLGLSPFDGGKSICVNNKKIINGSATFGEDTNVRGNETLTNSFPLDAFSVQGIEAACDGFATYILNPQRGIDINGSLQQNITLITEIIAGLPASHPRHLPMKSAVQATYQEARNQNMNVGESYKQAVIFACSSLDAIGVGL